MLSEFSQEEPAGTPRFDPPSMRHMPILRVEIRATDRIESNRIFDLYTSGKRHPPLDEEVIEEVWRRGMTPLGPPKFMGLSHGEPISYKFDVNIDSLVGGPN
jgi:hypothetical protein